MKINHIKINSYGKLYQKEIDFDKVNLIYGKNESGKSTLLNFINDIFYGISKNKNGKSISNLDKFKPISANADFSGKINYELINGNKYSVFRNFNSKNPIILDEYEKDISNEFKIDKNGINFFEEQTGINRDILNSTVIANQKEIELDENIQNNLLQKIANVVETGEEDLSFKTAIKTLDKIQLDEVGTSRSKDKPINKTEENIKKYTAEIREIESIKDQESNLEENKLKLSKELEEEKENKKVYEDVKEYIDKKEQQKALEKAYEDVIRDNKEKYKDSLKKSKGRTLFRNLAIALYIVAIIFIVSAICLKTIRLALPGMLFNIIALIFTIVYNNSKKHKDLKKEIELTNKEIKNIENNKEDDKELEELKQNLIKKYGIRVSELFDEDIKDIIKQNQERINYLELELHKIELDEKNIEPKLEKLADLTEKLAYEEENLKALNAKTEIIDRTREILEEAYEEMRNSVTPKFNKKLSENLEKFSNGKYKRVSISDGIKVELDNGDYLDANYLSTGILDQIYLSLRLAAMDEISSEPMPIILDEAFAYYDDERLKDVLEYLSKVDNQVIILTCTSREKEALDDLRINYNYIELK